MKEYLKAKRPFLLRNLVAIFLWLLIIVCCFTSIRTTILTNTAVAHIKERSVTPKTMALERSLIQTAEEFVFEWASYDSSNPNDYQNRLSRYIGDEFSINSPQGAQRCNYATAVAVEKSADNKKGYRVLVNANISRVITSSDVSYSLSPGRIINRREVDGSTEISYWQDYQQSAEVSFLIKDGSIEPVGIPVLKPTTSLKGHAPDQLIGHNDIPEDFKVFASQALDMYFSGKDMENFLAADCDLKAIGGYKLENTTVTAFKKTDGKAKAVVKVSLSADGVKNIEQSVVLEAEKKEKWLLLRLGGY